MRFFTAKSSKIYACYAQFTPKKIKNIKGYKSIYLPSSLLMTRREIFVAV